MKFLLLTSFPLRADARGRYFLGLVKELECRGADVTLAACAPPSTLVQEAVSAGVCLFPGRLYALKLLRYLRKQRYDTLLVSQADRKIPLFRRIARLAHLRLVLLPDALRLDLLAYDAAKAIAYREAQGVTDACVLGQIAPLDKEHHPHFSLEILGALPPKAFALWFLGSGPLRHELAARIAYDYLNARIPGSTLEIHNVLPLLDVLIFPPDSPLDSLALFEAAASGAICLVPESFQERNTLLPSLCFVPPEPKQWVNRVREADLSHREIRSREAILQLKQRGMDLSALAEETLASLEGN